jgi:Asp-tRNA(Asn)/Glu-tRNA(Gln) amidotransferase A subunit family amidase
MDSAVITASLDSSTGGAAPPWLDLPLRERVRRAEGEGQPADEWRAEASAWSATADEAYRACVELRPVGRFSDPVRVGVKDTLDAAGFATRLGLRRYRHYPGRDAAALRGVPAGAIVAKLATAQLGLGLDHGCRNPRFPHLNPSGSSTGSAAAVAAGICDVALGSDSTGSVRLPANACGVVGLRLTQDKRLHDGLFCLSPTLESAGWLARTADDLAFAWERFSLGPALPGPRSYRVGVGAGLLEDGCLPEIVAALDAVAAALPGHGHEPVPIRLDDLLPWRRSVWELVAQDARDAYSSLSGRLDEPLEESVAELLRFGEQVGTARRTAITDRLRRCRAGIAERFGSAGLDAWLLPTTSRFPSPAGLVTGTSTIPDFDDPETRRSLGYATVASFAGIPAITLPVAVDPAHAAPIGLQLMGPPHSEPLLLGLARQLELAADLTQGGAR